MDGMRRRMSPLAAVLVMMIVLAGCGGATGQSGPPGADTTAAAGGPPGADATTVVDTSAAATEEPLPPVGEAGVLTIWSYLAPDDPSTAAYLEAFKQQNPDVEINYTAFPEDNYQDKVRTALQAESPPDIALIEDRSWM